MLAICTAPLEGVTRTSIAFATRLLSWRFFLRHNQLGHSQQARAKLEVRPLRRLGINFEAHPVFVQDEVNDSARPSESRRISDAENTGALYALQDFPRLRLL